MRVLHVVATGQRRGAELFASELVAALNEHGVDQQIAVLRVGGGIHVPFDSTVRGMDRKAGRTTVIRRARQIRSLRTEIRGWAPDVIQAHGGEAAEAAVLASGGRRPPVVYRKIGVARRTSRSPIRGLHGMVARRASMVIAVAEAVRRDTAECFGVPLDRLVTIPNGIDPDRLRSTMAREAIRRSLNMPADAKVILSLGALVWEKDPLTQVRVAAKILAQEPDGYHVLAGDGTLRRSVEDEVTALGSASRTRVLGNRPDVGDLLAASDVMLHASRPNGMEGMPACLIEAGFANLPVAAFSVAGIDEVIEDGATGLLAPAGDADALAAGVLRLLGDLDLRHRMGRAAQLRCKNRFHIETIADRYLSLYEGIIRREDVKR